MEVRLYQCYSRAEVIAAFGGDGVGRLFCDVHFLVLPEAILCRCSPLGDPRTRSYIDGQVVVWKHPEWPAALPAEFTEFIAPRGLRPSTHVFLRREGEDRFCYIGQSRLCRCGIPQSVAALLLENELPREIW